MAKLSSFSTSHVRYFFTAVMGAVLIICALWAVNDSWPNLSTLRYKPIPTPNQEPADVTFYDDEETAYTLDKTMVHWDTKRREWLKHHVGFGFVKEDRVLVITGSQPALCRSPVGDHMLLRLFKNKVDYCRINGYGIFYNNAHLEPKMGFYWAKIPIVRAAMLAHPEIEWMFWVDSDAVFTDMDFKVPLDKYTDHNFVVYGRPDFYNDEEKSWLALSAGIFLIRNCQWSLDFMDSWAGMGPLSPNYLKWGSIMKSTFKDKVFSDSDDQSALVYMLLKENKWRRKVYVEDEYLINGYWLNIVDKFEDIAKKYLDIEKRVGALRRRHAEVVAESYASLREEYVVEGDEKRGGWRRPFITHFAGCQPCNGDHNPAFKNNSCLVGLERALNFADNQVLRNYGYMRPDIGNGSRIEPVPFDFPGDVI
ncbi:hypothetical protein OROGR_022088 [Orobanche gracilis]